MGFFDWLVERESYNGYERYEPEEQIESIDDTERFNVNGKFKTYTCYVLFYRNESNDWVFHLRIYPRSTRSSYKDKLWSHDSRFIEDIPDVPFKHANSPIDLAQERIESYEMRQQFKVNVQSNNHVYGLEKGEYVTERTFTEVYDNGEPQPWIINEKRQKQAK